MCAVGGAALGLGCFEFSTLGVPVVALGCPTSVQFHLDQVRVVLLVVLDSADKLRVLKAQGLLDFLAQRFLEFRVPR